MASTNISVLVVSYNTREITLACLRSVFEETRGIGFEVIVVDNASTDGSAEAIAAEFPQVKLLPQSRNLGFAAANNLAATEATGKSLLLLNPDTLVLDGAVHKLLAFAKSHPEAGIVGGRTLFADRSLNQTSCWGRPTPWSAFCQGSGLSSVFSGSRLFNPEAMPGWDRDTAREVDIVTGCFLLIRREIWEQLGGFDTEFFMYGEDADLCLRAGKMGVKRMICPEAEIVHYGGASEKIRADKMVRLFQAKAQLCAKHWTKNQSAFGVIALNLWAFSRMLWYGMAATIVPGKKDEGENWQSIWARRCEWRDAWGKMLVSKNRCAEDLPTPVSIGATAMGIL